MHSLDLEPSSINLLLVHGSDGSLSLVGTGEGDEAETLRAEIRSGKMLQLLIALRAQKGGLYALGIGQCLGHGGRRPVAEHGMFGCGQS